MQTPDALTPEQIEADTHRLRLERAQQIAEDDLRRRMIEQVPEIRSQVERMEEVLREIIELERSKMPPETGRGYLVLKEAPRGKYSGQGGIGTKKYKARGTLTQDPQGKEILKITLLPI
jgi:hypothetical protein